jgi:hypothetical protein
MMRALLEASDGLAPFDRLRHVNSLREALRDASRVDAEFSASAARWKKLQDAFDNSGRVAKEFFWGPLRVALDGMTPLDRELAAGGQQHLLSQAEKLLKSTQKAEVEQPTPKPHPSRKYSDDDFGTFRR